ncbi:MAG: hypothetical protein WB579_23460 [Bryobacteraceae bacterium]
MVRNIGRRVDLVYYRQSCALMAERRSEYRRRLPHFHPDRAHLFVTWRLHGALPVPSPDVIHATPGHAFAAKDRALGQNRGQLWLSDARVVRQVAEAIRTGESRKEFYELQAWVIMPNHVHMLLLPRVALPQNHPLDQRANSQGRESVAGAGWRAVLAG